MVHDLVKEIKHKNINISYDEGKLKYSGSSEDLSPDFIEKLNKNKYALMRHFWPDKCWNFMPINTEGSKIPVLYIHGGPSNYPISEHLGEDRPFFGYFYIGSEGEKIRYKNLEQFANEYIRQLRVIIPKGPYFIGGPSFGGHLAFEMANTLISEGHDVPAIFLVDSGLPDDRQVLSGLPFKTRLYEFAKKIYYWLYDLGWKFIFKGLSFMLPKIPADKRNKYIQWSFKDIIKRYKPAEKYKGKTIIFRASDNPSRYEYLGWEKHCEDIELIHFKGDHGSMYHDIKAVDLIKHKIKEVIDSIENNNS